MSRLIKSPEAGNEAFSDYQRDVLEPMLVEGAEEGALTDGADVMTQARSEAERKVREAYEEGLRRGIEAAKTHYAESVAESASALKEASAAIRKAHEEFLANIEPHVLALVNAITERILQREAKNDPDVLRTTVRSAIQALLDRERLLIRVHPQDFDALQQQRVRLLEEFDGVKHVEVTADAEISPGGCVVESDTLYLDAQWQAQLGQIFDALTEQP